MIGWKILLLLAFLATVGMTGSIILSMTFYTAYFSPGQSVMVFVNRCGEGFLEAAIVVPMVLVSSLSATALSLYLFGKTFLGVKP